MPVATCKRLSVVVANELRDSVQKPYVVRKLRHRGLLVLAHW